MFLINKKHTFIIVFEKHRINDKMRTDARKKTAVCIGSVAQFKTINIKQSKKILFVLLSNRDLHAYFEQIKIKLKNKVFPEIVVIHHQLPDQTLIEQYQIFYPIRLISINQLCVQRLIQHFPLNFHLNLADNQGVHALIVGFNPLSKAILYFILRFAHYNTCPPLISIMSEEPDKIKALLSAEIPQLDKIASLHYCSLQQREWDNSKKITGIYICLDSDSEGLQFAHQIIQKIEHEQALNPPVYLHQQQLFFETDIEQWNGQIYPFSNDVAIDSLASLLENESDPLAKIVHNYYQDSIDAQGIDLADTPAGNAWETLDETYRIASRNQALHLFIKLSIVNCCTVSVTDSDFFIFKAHEIENLAILEHHRWCVDRYLDGWRYNKTRDNQLKHHPQLIPYNDLSEAMKDLDRYAVRLMPVLLARNNVAIQSELIVSVVIESNFVLTRTLKKQLLILIKTLMKRYPNRRIVIVSRFLSTIEKYLYKIGQFHCMATHRLVMVEKLTNIIASLTSTKDKEDYLQQLYHSNRQMQFISLSDWKNWAVKHSDVFFYLGDEMKVEKSIGVQRLVTLNGEGKLRWFFDY